MRLDHDAGPQGIAPTSFELNRGGPLGGLLVVELAQHLAAEFAGGLLADMGATVVKVESDAGSPTRQAGFRIGGESSSLYFQSENRGKYSILAGLRDIAPAGRLASLLERADVVIEDLGPGELEVAGLAPSALLRRNKPLCVLRLSAYGQTGPLAGTLGDDRTAQAFGGVQILTGFPDRAPTQIDIPLADCWAGIHGASGVLIALLYARRTGRGQVIDLALYETILRMQEGFVRFSQTGELPERMGTHARGVVPGGLFPTRDGRWIALSGAENQFPRLCEAIGRPEAVSDPRFATREARHRNREATNALLAAWIAQRGAAEAEARFVEVGATAVAVRSIDEIMSDEHVLHRRSLLAVESESGSTILLPGPVPRVARKTPPIPHRAPTLGEHTVAVEAWLAGEHLRGAPTEAPAEPTSDSALGHLRVIDMSVHCAGTVAGAILADFGADVVLVELPAQGPRLQRAVPAFLATNRNKRSVTLDVRVPSDRERFLDLIRSADLLIENFRPGALERWDLAPSLLLEVNPGLSIVRASGYGQDGPYAARPAFNSVGVGFGGLAYVTGWPDRPPVRDGALAADYTTALFGAFGGLTALVGRGQDGVGEVIDVAMFESVLRMTGDMAAERNVGGSRRERRAGVWPLYPAVATAEATDGRYVTVSAAGWDQLLDALPAGEAAARASGTQEEAAREAFDRVCAGRRSGEIVDLLREHNLPATVVYSVAELAAEPHVWERQNLLRVTHEELGDVIVPGVVPTLSLTPGRVRSWSLYPGSDNQALLGGA